MMNSIRFQTTASLRVKGEAREAQAAPERGGQEKRQIPVMTARARRGLSEMVGGRKVGSCRDVKRGSRTKGGAEFMAKELEEPRLGGDRALVVAKKSRNWDGVKEGRKAMAGRDRQTKREIGIVPFGADRVEAKAYGRKSHQSGRTLCNGVAQQKGFSNPMLTVKVSGQPDSQLESRMREIRPSGSGGGAVLSRPYLIP